ncbi:hypothetical protein BD289DRAFT_189648 [Coniella lustricola]|uniref:Uncharacterized protein n=1 Tax=Coniella lustricola TaxID=2025994 RepID=A0A2T3ACW6_9PEZI|nr:hypothetical protein BD289DRAFT_189648 [Coniella lustricola]
MVSICGLSVGGILACNGCNRPVSAYLSSLRLSKILRSPLPTCWVRASLPTNMFAPRRMREAGEVRSFVQQAEIVGWGKAWMSMNSVMIDARCEPSFEFWHSRPKRWQKPTSTWGGCDGHACCPAAATPAGVFRARGQLLIPTLFLSPLQTAAMFQGDARSCLKLIIPALAQLPRSVFVRILQPCRRPQRAANTCRNEDNAEGRESLSAVESST